MEKATEVNEIDWERRRRNLRILFAAAGTNPTAVSKANGLSPNTLSQFTSGRTNSLSSKTLEMLVRHLGLSSVADLDTDNPIGDPKIAIRKLLDVVPEAELPSLLRELQARFPESD